MNLDDIADQFHFAAVPVWVTKRDKSIAFGTGLIFSRHVGNEESIPVLVSTKEIFQESVDVKLGLWKREPSTPSEDSRTIFNVSKRLFTSVLHDTVNLAAVPLGPMLNQLREKNIDPFYRTVTAELLPDADEIDTLSAIENVMVIGYPKGLYDKTHISPIVGRGITSTPYRYDYNDTSSFVIDTGAYPCSPGSPVMIYERRPILTGDGIQANTRFYLLGIVAETITRQHGGKKELINGYYRIIKISEIAYFVEHIIDELAREANQES